jgi:hypothetical protein
VPLGVDVAEIRVEGIQIEMAGREFGYVADPIVAQYREGFVAIFIKKSPGHLYQVSPCDAGQPIRVVTNNRNRMTTSGTARAGTFCAALRHRPVRLRLRAKSLSQNNWIN